MTDRRCSGGFCGSYELYFGPTEQDQAHSPKSNSRMMLLVSLQGSAGTYDRITYMALVVGCQEKYDLVDTIFSKEDISNVIRNLKKNSAVSLDGIPTIFLINTREYIKTS